MMKSLQLSRYRAVALFLASSASVLQAQKNVYITLGTQPETTTVVSAVDRITYADGKANFHSYGKVKSFEAKDISIMGLQERDRLRSERIPFSFQKEFDFDISLADADRTWSVQAEGMPAENEEKLFEDFVENSQWTQQIRVVFGGTQAQVTGTSELVKAEVNGNHVTVRSDAEGVEYILSGTTIDGSFKIYGTKKAKLVLEGLQLTNPKGPALNNQCKKRLFLVLKANTENYLKDGGNYTKVEGEDQRGCLFSEGQLCVSGAGALTVEALHKNGIASDDYIHQISGFVKVLNYADKGDAVKAKELFRMGGGALQVLAQGAAAKGISSDSLFTVTGGKITVITTGDHLWNESSKDYSASCGIRADSTMTLSGGEIHVLATGIGGKGINAGKKNIKTHDLIVDGARIYVRTTGPRVQDERGSTSPKGIKAAHDIIFLSGSIYSRCSGGDGAEGLEAKNDFIMKGGTLRSYCYDDGLNAVNSSVDGGDIFVCSTANDGYDCNGGVYLNGGTFYAIGAPAPQAGIDNDGKTFGMNGGEVVGIGGYSTTPWDSKSKQVSILCYLKKEVPYIAILDAQGNNVLTVKTPATYNPLGVLMSSPKLEQGKPYKIVSALSLLAGTEEKGIVKNAQLNQPTTEYEFTTTNLLTTLGSNK